jgi:hypothetical protein
VILRGTQLSRCEAQTMVRDDFTCTGEANAAAI